MARDTLSMTEIFPACQAVLLEAWEPLHYVGLTRRAVARLGVLPESLNWNRQIEDVREKLLDARRYGLAYTGAPECLAFLSSPVGGLPLGAVELPWLYQATVSRWLKDGHSQLMQDATNGSGMHNALSTKTHYHIANCRLEHFQPPQGLTFPLIIADPPWNVSDPGHQRERTARPNRPFTKDFGQWDWYENDQVYLEATQAWLQRLSDVAAEALVLRTGAARFRFGKRGGQQPHNFLEAPQVAGNERQKLPDDSATNLAQKPLALTLLWIAQVSKSGDWVLDAFAGTGTASFAALSLGRNACAVEADGMMVTWLEQKRTKPFYPGARP